MNKPRLIDVQHLTLSLGGAQILRDLTFSVEGGEYVSIIGPNGAGKSTLVKCLAGIHRKWSGSVDIRGRALQEYPHRQLARNISYVPQSVAGPLPFTVHEFVMMGRYPHLSPFTSCRPEDEAVVEHTLELTGTEHFRDRMMDTLSGGERQNVLIAAALAQGARILLLDEPVTFLDYRHQVEILATLKSINRHPGITIVAVSHNLNDAIKWSDRVLALREGREAFNGNPKDILDNAVLERIYDIPFKFVPNPPAELPLVIPAAHSQTRDRQQQWK